MENAAVAFDKNKAANKEMKRKVNKEEELYFQIGKLKVEGVCYVLFALDELFFLSLNTSLIDFKAFSALSVGNFPPPI